MNVYCTANKASVILLSMLLAGCVGAVPIVGCPAPVPYTVEQQNQAADELCRLSGLDSGCDPKDMKPTMLGAMMVDYGQERKKLRECQ